ncbi:MAG: 3-oxoacyl-[acyl-carrier-protein] reductase [Alphaproteobacteria bacterium]|nr:3-oxoacyl-[acyl-carrier-protein] reductase [Alphaproteobacteria bacterium]
MFDLEGKTALVTGATGGIGGAIARQLHDRGAIIVASGTRTEKLDELAGNLGDRCHVVAANLSNSAAPDALIAEAVEVAGSVDILINNAGLTRDNLAMRMKDDEWQQVIDVNLTSAFRLTRAVLRGMMKARWGRVVTVTSVVGATGNPGQANYAASKAGLTGMSKALAQEVASRGITVNCIAPGFIETPMTDALSDDQKATLLERIPSGRLGVVNDVAACAVFLASAEASYVTGQTLHVNGGMAML